MKIYESNKTAYVISVHRGHIIWYETSQNQKSQLCMAQHKTWKQKKVNPWKEFWVF